MVISLIDDRGLKALPPSVLVEPNFIFFQVIMELGDKKPKEIFLKKSKIKNEFLKTLKYFGIKESKDKIKYEKIISELINKLNTITWNETENEILDIDWKSFEELYALLKFIKKSDERKIQWGIYHLFFKGNKKIELQKLKDFLSELKIKNVEKLTKNIVKSAKSEGLKIKLEGDSLIIESDIKNDFKILKQTLADTLEYYSRRSHLGLEQEVLELLDLGSYSNKEISQILEADKSHVSKTMKKLLNKKEITHSSFGKKGMHYYTTNCKNCPFGTNYDSCRKEAISYIMNFLNEQFGIKGDGKMFEAIEHNQSLLHIKSVLKYALKNKATEIESATLTALSGIYFAIFLNVYNQEISKLPKKSYFSISHIMEKMPLSSMAGFQIGQYNGATLMLTYMDKILSPHLRKRQIKEITEQALLEYKKLSSVLKPT